MAKTFTANVFSAKSLKELQKELKQYRDSLQGKTQQFIELLLQNGIEVAQEFAVDYGGRYGTHEMARYVSFRKETNTSDGIVYGILFGSGEDIVGEWYVNDGSGNYSLTRETINAMMALEFGTAAWAMPQQTSFGVTGGKGTLSKHGHENDTDWRIVTKLDSKGKPIEWKHATAIEPTRPMYQAGLAMYEKVKQIATSVFGS